MSVETIKSKTDAEGIQKGLNILKTEAIKHGFKLDNEEAKNAK